MKNSPFLLIRHPGIKFLFLTGLIVTFLLVGCGRWTRTEFPVDQSKLPPKETALRILTSAMGSRATTEGCVLGSEVKYQENVLIPYNAIKYDIRPAKEGYLVVLFGPQAHLAVPVKGDKEAMDMVYSLTALGAKG